ncbi:mutator type transposase [Tanacetum coccineum]|uniref:Mutator type transposase n=1 Tax=Tanacetum coccineum TaxID=301880 RepID=A0ABQ5F1S3_9ASTR
MVVPFTSPRMIRYKGGKVNWVDDIDSDIFSIVEVTSMMKELGYQNLCMAYYYKKPNTDVDNGLTELAIDKDACEMLMYVDKFKVIELYTHHSVNKKHVLIQEPLGTASKPNEPDIGYGSEAEVDVSEDEWLQEALKKLSIKSKKGQQPSRKEVGESSMKEVGQSSKNGSGSENGSESSSDPDVEWVGCKEKVVEENEVFDLEEVDHEDFDSGSDSDEDVRRKALRKVGRMNQAKFSKVEQRRQLWLKKNDKLRVRVVCRGQVLDFANNNMSTIVPITCNPKGLTSKVQSKSISKKEKVTKPKESYGCPWAVQVSKFPNEDTWEVKTLEDIHKCLQTRIVTKCTATFLSREVEESIKPNPKIPLSVLKDQLQKKFELKDYCVELKEMNPNTIVKIEVEAPEFPNSEERKFKWIYICLGPLKDGFRAGGRDFLGLDGCFLSGPYPGQILTAVGVDPNNGIYPLAYDVVESESKDSWKWFLDYLGDDLELFRNSNFTFISDRQKGVIPAIAETFPSAEHRFCLKHIYDNMKLSWRGKLYKELLWKCATATTIQKFDKRMEEMKNHNIEAYEWLRKIPPQHWARSHFSGRAKSNILLNNMCEVLNRQLVDGRDKPIITCLEYIREYLMKRIVNVQKVQDKCDGPLTPNAAKIFKLVEKAAAKLKVDWNGSDLYQEIGVEWDTLHTWDMASNGTDTGIPESYCNPCHWLLTWKEMNMFKINPVNGPQAWKKSDVPTTIIPPKPHLQIGRPPKKRKKSAAELADEIMKSNKMTRHAGAGLQGGGDAGVGGSQTTQSSVGRAQHPSFLHASPTKITKSSVKRSGP